MIMVPVLLAFTLIVGYLSVSLYQDQKQGATALTETISKEYANGVKGELEVGLNTAHNIADMTLGFMEIRDTDRASITLALKKILEGNDRIYGVWIGFESNAFDRKDDEYANKGGYGPTGRFIPFWHRQGERIEKSYLQETNQSAPMLTTKIL